MYLNDDEQRVEQNCPLRMKRSLTKAEVLRIRRDISHVFRRGKRIQCNGLKLFITSNQLNYSRILVSPVRKFGTAVARNRAKRHLREIYRLNKCKICTGQDIAIVLFPGTYSYADRKKALLYGLGEGGCLV